MDHFQVQNLRSHTKFCNDLYALLHFTNDRQAICMDQKS